MAIATGQMMREWVHLVMNVSSADGCSTRVHLQTVLHTQHPPPPPRADDGTSSAAADVLKVPNFTRTSVTSSSIHRVAKLVALSNKYRELIRIVSRWGGWDEASGDRVRVTSISYPPSSRPLSARALLLNYTEKPGRLIGGSINCPPSFQTWHWLILTQCFYGSYLTETDDICN